MPVRADILPARYRNAELIGRGGMGEIFRALDEVLGRDVAVKLLAERFAHEPEVRERFTREALTAARLSGEPNVVTIFDVGEHHGRPFIVMEHLGGGSLEDVLRREGAQPPGRALTWLEVAGRALDAAHAAGIVHRDVKPANLLLDAGGDVHVADFGIASAAGLDSFTRPGTVLGTAGYLSPEQAGGERATPASDRYALGVVAFELLSGERPFARDNPTAEAAAHVRAPIPAISAANPALPRTLDPVFDQALAKDPAARFASAGELVAALRGALDADAGRTRVAAPAPLPVEPTRTVRTRPPRQSLGPVGVVVTVLALAVLGGLVAYALTRDDDQPQTQQPQGRTVVRTLVTTAPGTTERVTVTTQAEEAAAAATGRGRRRPHRPVDRTPQRGPLRGGAAGGAAGARRDSRAAASSTRRTPTTTSARRSSGSAAAPRRSHTSTARSRSRASARRSRATARPPRSAPERPSRWPRAHARNRHVLVSETGHGHSCHERHTFVTESSHPGGRSGHGRGLTPAMSGADPGVRKS